MSWWFSKPKYQVSAIDMGGRSHSLNLREKIIHLRSNQFKWTNWPFLKQTPEELERYLYLYDGIWIVELPESGLLFIPISISKRQDIITKLNYMHTKFVIERGFQKNINIAFDLEKNKKNIPFIFDNANQIAPAILQEWLFKEFERAFNFGVSNRINKNKKAIIKVKNGTQIAEAIKLNLIMDDYSPFVLVEEGDKRNPLNVSGMKQLTDNSPDFYNSIAQDKRDILSDIKLWNGLITGTTTNKSSAQETNDQSNGFNRESAEILSARLKDRKKFIKNINSIFDKKIEISLNNRYKIFIRENLENSKDEDENG